MFKAPDERRPREWGQARHVNPWILAAAFIVFAALVIWLAIFPYGGEIALAVFGMAFAVLVYRSSGKHGR